MSSLHPEGVCHPPELPPLGAECAAVQSPPADAPKPNLGSSYEIQRIQHRIDGFNWKNSHAWLCLCSQFGPRLSQEELVSIAELTASRLGIRFDRDGDGCVAKLLRLRPHHRNHGIRDPHPSRSS
jgi:hypothetical protein